MVQRPRQRQHASARHSTVGAHESSHSAHTGWDPDAAAGVRTQRPQGRSDCHRCARAAATAARRSGDVPWIADRAVVRVAAGRAERELVQVELARHDGASLLELGVHRRVRVGNPVAEETAASSRRNACGVDQVFECDWNPVQRTQVPSVAQQVVRSRRLLTRQLGRNRDVGIEQRLSRFQPREHGLGQRQGCQ